MTKEKIDQFFNSKKFAVAGVSEDKKKFGGALFKELSKAGFDMTPINPKLEAFEGKKCYASVSELPEDIDALLISTKPKHSIKLMKEAQDKGINQVWLQQGAEDEDCIEYAKNSEMNIIYKKCAIMFGNPKGFHGFHAFLSKLFGTYPK